MSAPPPRPAPSARTGIVYLVDQGAVSAGNFLTGLLLGRVCEREDFGAYTIAFSLMNALNTLQSSLVSGPMAVFAPGREGGALRRYLGGSLLFHAVLSVGVAGIVVAGALAWHYFVPSSAYAWALLCMGIALLFEQMQEFMRRAMLSRFRGTAALMNDSLCTLTRLAVLGAVVLWRSSQGVPGITSGEAFLCVAGASALASLVGLVQIWTTIAPSQEALAAAAAENWTFGRWILAQSLVAAVGGPLFAWFLALNHGPEAAGALGAAQTLVFATNPLVFGMSNYFGSAASAAYAARGMTGVAETTRRYLIASVAVTGTVLIVIAICGEWALRLAYQGRWDHLHGLVAALAGSTFVYVLGRPLVAAMHALRRPELLFRTQVVALIVTMAVTWPLTAAYSGYGVAIASAVGSAVLLVSRGLAYRELLRTVRT